MCEAVDGSTGYRSSMRTTEENFTGDRDAQFLIEKVNLFMTALKNEGEKIFIF